MNIKSLRISNYKSIEEMELQNPNPFSVFVGPNGAGKSNIFESLEFFALKYKLTNTSYVVDLFGKTGSLLKFDSKNWMQDFHITFEKFNFGFNVTHPNKVDGEVGIYHTKFYFHDRGHLESMEEYEERIKTLYPEKYNGELRIFPYNYSRLFINNGSIKKLNIVDEGHLASDGSNLEKVLSRVLQNENTREEIVEWLQILIPEFKDIQIETSSLSGDVNYVIFEKHTNKPFPKHLISDGTKNILALLTAVYQSEEPQFLCIEEPENGLHPHVIEHLVSLFRTACKDKGHYIWLNSHSQTLVRQLTADEIIVVEKKNGATTAKQFQGENFFGMKMDDAWLTNALGGGLP
jgi:predicted ATPase